MSFNDGKYGALFPTRDVATGGANERQMLRHVDGADSFKTSIRDMADGSKVMLRTRNGMPEFTTTENKPAAKRQIKAIDRTFVFCDFSNQLTSIVANRLASAFKIVIPALVTDVNPAYNVLPINTSKTRWRDVLRVEGGPQIALPSVTGGKLDYNAVEQAMHIAAPASLVRHGLPEYLPGLAAPLSGWFSGTNEVTAMVDANLVYRHGVAAHDTSGAVAYFTEATGGARKDPDTICGVEYDPPSRAYRFHWQGYDYSGVGSNITSCYVAIKPAASGAPTVIDSEQSAIVPEPIYYQVTYNNPPPSDTLIAIGSYRTRMERTYSGIGALTADGWAPYEYTQALIGNATAYCVAREDSWSKTANYSKQYVTGFNSSELVADIAITGSETFTHFGSGNGADYPDKYATISQGSDYTTWSRVSDGAVEIVHTTSGESVYSIDFKSTSDLRHGFKKQSRLIADYSGFDASNSSTKFGMGGIYAYFPGSPEYSAMALRVCQEDISAYNADESQKEWSRVINGPAAYPLSDVRIEFDTIIADESVRNDTQDLVLRSRDFIFYDGFEGVSLALVTKFECHRTNSATPAIDINHMPEAFDVQTNVLTIWYELNIRGAIHEFPVYFNDAMWGPQIPFGQGYPTPEDFGNPDKTFSGVFNPGAMSYCFAPLYMAQGMCPWIAYTTKAEEAAGAIPEFYMDISLHPYFGGRGYENITPFGDATVKFVAHHITKLCSNFLAYFAPTNIDMNTLFFPTPKRITYAKGIGETWINKLGAPFSDATRVMISRI